MKYEVKKTIENIEYIERIDADGIISFIPKDLTNSDYQRYLRWLNGEEETQGGLN